MARVKASESTLHGWVIIDKPLGMSSSHVVSAIQRGVRNAGLGKVKAGHGGTLDPLADGVLPIALGEATKISGRMLDATKAYRFTVQFGTQTDTLDAEGTVIATSDVRPDAEAIAAVLPRFTGAITQIPPAFSALKVDGQRAYALARDGQEVELQPRDVTIHALTCDAVTPDSATFTASVSKGTYIRSLARDIAIALNSVGHVIMLRRIKAGPFTETQAISLDKWAEIAIGPQLEEVILPLEAGLDGIPALPLAPGEAGYVRQGRTLPGQSVQDGQYLATDNGVPVALVEITDGVMKVLRGFNL